MDDKDWTEVPSEQLLEHFLSLEHRLDGWFPSPLQSMTKFRYNEIKREILRRMG
jgi:hypothetical protein